MDAGVFESAPVQSPPGSHHRPGAHHRDRNRVLSFPQNAGGTAEKESLVAFRASTELSRGRDSGRRPFLGAPSRLSSDRTGGSVISTLEEKDSYDVGGAKSDGHGGAESSCQKHPRELTIWRFSIYGGACLAGDPKSPHTTSTQVLSITGPSADLQKLEPALFGDTSRSTTQQNQPAPFHKQSLWNG